MKRESEGSRTMQGPESNPTGYQTREKRENPLERRRSMRKGGETELHRPDKRGTVKDRTWAGGMSGSLKGGGMGSTWLKSKGRLTGLWGFNNRSRRSKGTLAWEKRRDLIQARARWRF